jgi:hypothetical protein
MTTMTMPVVAERAPPKQDRGVSQLMPFLLAMALLMATGVASLLISGPMH